MKNLGLIPDFAMLRDRISKKTKPFTQKNVFFVIIWLRPGAKDWQRFESVSLILAGLVELH